MKKASGSNLDSQLVQIDKRNTWTEDMKSSPA